MNARLDATTDQISTTPTMGHNRKRVRHRSRHSRKPFDLLPVPLIIEAPLSLSTKNMRHHDYTTLPHMAYTSTHSPNFFPGPSFPVAIQPKLLQEEESAASRDRRIFGGDDDETRSALELRGPMLDVVLGLFNGIDYDDSLC
jgi:hypothetical protein